MASIDPDLIYFAELDKRLVKAVRGIRMLEALSWPARSRTRLQRRETPRNASASFCARIASTDFVRRSSGNEPA